MPVSPLIDRMPMPYFRETQIRRRFLKLAGTGLLGISSVGLNACRTESQPSPEQHSGGDTLINLFIGTYTSGASEGIYRALFNTDSGEVSGVQLVAEAANPSFIAIDDKKQHLFAVNELSELQDRPTGAVSSFRLDGFSLGLIGQQPTHGGAPCYISLDQSGRWAFVANYGNGYVAVFPVDEDGRLGEASSIMQHEGSSVNERRQEGPHAHCFLLDPAGRYAFSADLGIDKIMIYRFDAETGSLTPNEPAFAAVRPGAGPRHFTFHPGGRHAFVINELDSTITAFAYDSEQGRLSTLETISTLPAGFEGESYCADIHVHPNGQFIYGSNRGHNSVAVVSFDAETGKMALLQTESVGGDWPRNFTLDPSGRFLLVANQRSDNIVVFRIDQEKGLLTPTGHQLDTPTPVCLKFA